MKLLITGGCGFIPPHLVSYLITDMLHEISITYNIIFERRIK